MLRILVNYEKENRMNPGKENRARVTRADQVISDYGSIDANIGSDFVMKNKTI
jgi:hypothetical protein